MIPAPGGKGREIPRSRQGRERDPSLSQAGKGKEDLAFTS